MSPSERLGLEFSSYVLDLEGSFGSYLLLVITFSLFGILLSPSLFAPFPLILFSRGGIYRSLSLGFR